MSRLSRDEVSALLAEIDAVIESHALDDPQLRAELVSIRASLERAAGRAMSDEVAAAAFERATFTKYIFDH